MKLLRGMMKIMVVYLCLSFVYTFSYSILNSAYLQERENFQLKEMSKIETELLENIQRLDSDIMRRHITRIVKVAYNYGIEQVRMEEIIKNDMKKNGWLFIKKENYSKVERKILIFKKEGYECEIDFFGKNKFIISLVNDDIYNKLNW